MKKFLIFFISFTFLPFNISQCENEKRNAALIGVSFLIAAYGLYNWNKTPNAPIQPSTPVINNTQNDIIDLQQQEPIKTELEQFTKNVNKLHDAAQQQTIALEKQKEEIDKLNITEKPSSFAKASSSAKATKDTTADKPKPTLWEIIKNTDFMELTKNNLDY